MRLGFTEAGWALLVLATLMGAVGFYADLNLVYLLASAIIALLATNLVVAALAVGGVEVERDLPAEVVAEAPARVRLRLRRRARALPAGGSLTVEETYAGPGGPVRCFCLFGASPAGRPVVSRYEVVFPRRGEYRLESPWIESLFPFGLAWARRRLRAARETVVAFPRTGRLRIAPHLVGDYRSAAAVPADYGFEPAYRGWTTRDRSLPGHIGSPQAASGDKGEALLQAFAEGVAQLLRRVIAWDGSSWRVGPAPLA